MCGIVGIVSRFSNGFSQNEANMFETMLFIDTFRGWDSTGVFGVDNHGNLEMHKEASHGPDFICTKEYGEFSKAAIRSGKILVGHNRAATRGTINDANAHPFCVDDKIVLVQNGTMRGDHKKHADVEVDTHAIAHVLAKAEDITSALESFDAAYALVWYNVPEQTLYLIRNSERPLFLVEFDGGGGFMFASEKETILYAIAKYGQHNLKLKEEPYQLPAGTLMAFNLKTSEVTKTPLTFRPKQYPVSMGYQGRNLDHAAWANAFYGGVDDVEDAVITQTLPRNVTHLPPSKPEDITVAFSELIVKDQDLAKFAYFASQEHPTAISAATEGTDHILALANANGGYVMAEIVDYRPANKYARCTVWHMIAELVVADPPDNLIRPQVVLHYILRNHEEEGVLNLIGKLIEMKVTGTQIMSYRDPRDSENVALAHCFSTDVKAVTVQ
jgi:hypothetical protein